MNDATTHLTPAVRVLTTNDNDIGRYAQIAQGAMEANRLFGLILDLGLDHEEVDITAGTRLASSVGPEQDHLRIGSCRCQAAAGLGNQGLVNYRHRPKW